MSAQASVSRRIAEHNVESGVLIKLVVFSISLGVVPLGSYFFTEKYVWNGNSTYAAITAIISANIVLVSYIILSLLEDREERKIITGEIEKDKETRKER
ncbi:hypothetical protein EWM64_g196 [Hericium alpestre]|uniref:Vacuolar ATPase assembly integral membrane protein VMA21 n=1 Tax=Hericium alpestre TaxID=135208 RepID=A0A4Z0ACH7_9AGAM|nr:hypothetical protein EWM64_g196 [Hericium alpestre]